MRTASILLVNLVFKLILFYPCQPGLFMASNEPHHLSFYKSFPAHKECETVLCAHALGTDMCREWKRTENEDFYIIHCSWENYVAGEFYLWTKRYRMSPSSKLGYPCPLAGLRSDEGWNTSHHSFLLRNYTKHNNQPSIQNSRSLCTSLLRGRKSFLLSAKMTLSLEGFFWGGVIGAFVALQTVVPAFATCT